MRARLRESADRNRYYPRSAEPVEFMGNDMQVSERCWVTREFCNFNIFNASTGAGLPE